MDHEYYGCLTAAAWGMLAALLAAGFLAGLAIGAWLL